MDENKTRIVNPSREGKVTVKERELQIPNELKIIAVQNDNLVENVYFEIPKTFDEVNDLSTFELRVNWLNANGDADSDAVEIVSAEGETIVFKWNPTEFLTKYEGTVKISIFAIHEDGRKWNSAIAELTVLKGIVLSDEIAKKFPSVIEDLLKRVSYLENHNAQMQKTKVYDTTVEMLSDESLKISDKVKTLGYEAINDGGQAEFLIGESSDDLQLSLNNGLFAKLVYADTVYTSQLGVKNGDMTLLINDLFNKVRSNTKVVFDKQLDITVDFSKLPDNPYPNKRAFIDLLNKDNIYINFGHSKFSVVSNNYNNYVICYVDTCNNFKCENGEFVGDRKTHQYGNPQKPNISDEFGHGFTLWNNKAKHMNYLIKNMNIHDFTGDGIVTSNAYSNSKGCCKIKNCSIHHIRRNGIAVIDSDEVEITKCHIYDVGDSDGIAGKLPKSCIDLEPHYKYTSTINKIIIDDCKLEKCSNFGIICDGNKFAIPYTEITNCVLNSIINVVSTDYLKFLNNACYFDEFNGDSQAINTTVIIASKIRNSQINSNKIKKTPNIIILFKSYNTLDFNNVYNTEIISTIPNANYRMIEGNFYNCYLEGVQMYGGKMSNISTGELNGCTIKNCQLNFNGSYPLATPAKFCNISGCKTETASAQNKYFNCIFDTKSLGANSVYKNCSFEDE